MLDTQKSKSTSKLAYSSFGQTNQAFVPKVPEYPYSGSEFSQKSSFADTQPDQIVPEKVKIELMPKLITIIKTNRVTPDSTYGWKSINVPSSGRYDSKDDEIMLSQGAQVIGSPGSSESSSSNDSEEEKDVVKKGVTPKHVPLNNYKEAKERLDYLMEQYLHLIAQNFQESSPGCPLQENVSFSQEFENLMNSRELQSEIVKAQLRAQIAERTKKLMQGPNRGRNSISMLNRQFYSPYGKIIGKDGKVIEQATRQLYPYQRSLKLHMDKYETYDQRNRKNQIRELYASKYSIQVFKKSQHKQTQSLAVQRISQQAIQRVQYNLQVIQESKVITKIQTTNMTYEDLKKQHHHHHHHHRHSHSHGDSRSPDHHHHHGHGDSPDHHHSHSQGHHQQSRSNSSSCKDGSIIESCIEDDSFGSDESYYDENEDFELACINKDQEDNKLFYKMTQKENKEHNQLQIKEDAQKLIKIFQVADFLNAKIIQDRNIAPITKFMRDLPAFEQKFHILTKTQVRQCFEKMKLVIQRRGTILVKQNKVQKQAYIILLGIINLYDENIPLEPEVKNFKTESSLFLTQQTEEKDPIEQIDDSLNIIIEKQPQKIKSLKAGEVLGSLENRQEEFIAETTAICKSDCILLQLEQGIFSILKRQKMVKHMQMVADELVNAFPKITKYYTMIRLIEQAHIYFQLKTFKKGETIQIQGDSSEYLYIIISGQVSIFKNLEYFDENDLLQKKEQLIMEISQSEIIGEDPIWYNRNHQYTAKVMAPQMDVKTLVIENSVFLKHFAKVKDIQYKIFDVRCQFIEQRYKNLKFENEYAALSYNNQFSQLQKNQWEIYLSKAFNDPKNRMVNKKLKEQYLRDSSFNTKSVQEIGQLKIEKEKQLKKEVWPRIRTITKSTIDFSFLSKNTKSVVSYKTFSEIPVIIKKRQPTILDNKKFLNEIMSLKSDNFSQLNQSSVYGNIESKRFKNRATRSVDVMQNLQEVESLNKLPDIQKDMPAARQKIKIALNPALVPTNISIETKKPQEKPKRSRSPSIKKMMQQLRESTSVNMAQKRYRRKFKFEPPTIEFQPVELVDNYSSQKNLIKKGLIHQQRKKRFVDVFSKYQSIDFGQNVLDVSQHSLIPDPYQQRISSIFSKPMSKQQLVPSASVSSSKNFAIEGKQTEIFDLKKPLETSLSPQKIRINSDLLINMYEGHSKNQDTMQITQESLFLNN